MAERSYNHTGLTVTVDGQNLSVFPFWPNYRKDFIERWEWQTDVLESFNGEEQRICTRHAPRRYFEYEVFARGNDRAALDSYLHAGQNKLFMIPDWNRGKKVPPTIMINGEEASLYPIGLGLANTLFTPTGNEQPFAFVSLEGVEVNDYVIGFLAPDWHEIRRVISIHPDYGIQLDIDTHWPVGTIVCPLVMGRMNQEQSVTRVTPDFSYATVSFTILSEEYSYATEPTGLSTYSADGSTNPYLVVDLPHDWSDGINATYEYRTKVLDNKTANQLIDTRSPTPRITQSVSWYLHTRPQVLAYLRLINHCKGRLVPFWWSTGTKDLIPVHLTNQHINPVLDVLPIGSEAEMDELLQKTNPPPFGTHLQLTYKTGEVFRTSISSTILRTNDSPKVYRMILGDTLNINGVEDIKMISLLRLARFDNDKIEIAYKGPAFAMAANSIKVLKNVV